MCDSRQTNTDYKIILILIICGRKNKIPDFDLNLKSEIKNLKLKMRVFKFGGASVKDAEGIKNVYDVLQKVGYEDVILVVSAMGKTTNALEVVIKNYFEKSEELNSSVQEIKLSLSNRIRFI